MTSWLFGHLTVYSGKLYLNDQCKNFEQGIIARPHNFACHYYEKV